MLSTLYVKLIGLAVIALLVATAIFYVHHLHSLIDELEAKNTALVTSNTSLQSAIDVQNKAVADLKTAADSRLAAAQVEISKAHAETITAKASATKMYAKTPPPVTATCEVRESSTLDLINGSAK